MKKIVAFFESDFCSFWQASPLFFIGVFGILGVGYGLTGAIVFVPITFIWIFPLLVHRKWIFLIFAFGAIVYGAHFGKSRIDQLPKDNVTSGKGEFIIENISKGPFRNNLWVFTGRFISFSSDHKKYQNIPCQFSYMGTKNRPRANKSYLLQGALIKKSERSFFFKQDKKSSPIANNPCWNLIELRFYLKNTVHAYLKKNLRDKNSLAFLNALITGNNEDRYIRFSFAKLGLQHLMAISGFHFSLLMFFFSLLLSKIQTKWKSFLLLLIVNSYFLFLGKSPSITRAYLSIQLSLIAILIGRRYSALNALGLGLIVEILLDPLAFFHLGLQLSYLACGGIFLIYPTIEQKLRKIFYLRKPEEIKSLSYFGKMVVYTNSFLRVSLSMSIAINIILTPILLYQFHTFPLMSLLYNLFIPLLVSGCLFLALSVIGLSLMIPSLSYMLFAVLSFVTKISLNFLFTTPAPLQVSLSLTKINFSLMALAVSGIFFLFIANSAKQKEAAALMWKI